VHRVLWCWLEHDPSGGARARASSLYLSLRHAGLEYDGGGDEPAGASPAAHCRAARLVERGGAYRWAIAPRSDAERHPAWASAWVRAAAYASLGRRGRELGGLESTVLALAGPPADDVDANAAVARLAASAGVPGLARLPGAARLVGLAASVCAGPAGPSVGWACAAVDPARVPGGEAAWTGHGGALPGGALPRTLRASEPASPELVACLAAVVTVAARSAGVAEAEASAAGQAVVAASAPDAAGPASGGAAGSRDAPSLLLVAHACAAVATVLESLSALVQAAGRPVDGVDCRSIGDIGAATALLSPIGVASELGAPSV